MDERIAREAGMSIPEIFEKYGEEYFRKLETELLSDIQGKKNRIVSCGGGVVLRQQNVEMMKKSGKVVLLTANPQTILKRVENNKNRPLLEGRKTIEDIQNLMEARRARYEEAADIVVCVENKNSEDICIEIMKKLGLGD